MKARTRRGLITPLHSPSEGRATNPTTNSHLESTAAALGTLDDMDPGLAAIVLDSPPLWKLPS
jgi:hypothetical protein